MMNIIWSGIVGLFAGAICLLAARGLNETLKDLEKPPVIYSTSESVR